MSYFTLCYIQFFVGFGDMVIRHAFTICPVLLLYASYTQFICQLYVIGWRIAELLDAGVYSEWRFTRHNFRGVG